MYIYIYTCLHICPVRRNYVPSLQNSSWTVRSSDARRLPYAAAAVHGGCKH